MNGGLFCLITSIALWTNFVTASAAVTVTVDDKGSGFGERLRGDVPEGTADFITPDTDAAIKTGLDWLVRQQKSNGAFGSGSYQGSLAVTSLAAMALMSSGSSPGRGPYGAAIDKALGYVMESASPSGLIVQQGNSQVMYNHGFATLFLSEAYGMTHRAELREKLTKAIRLIIDTQNAEGGWRYQPIRRDADLSVSICQINALRAARNAGLFVPKETVDGCLKYVEKSQKHDGSFRYTLNSEQTSLALTAAGLVALYSAGRYEGKPIDDAIKYLTATRTNDYPTHLFYRYYYTAQAMWIRGGDDWNRWYPKIRDELLRKFAGGHWTDSICNEYGTAMALIVLQIPNSMLPIFQR